MSIFIKRLLILVLLAMPVLISAQTSTSPTVQVVEKKQTTKKKSKKKVKKPSTTATTTTQTPKSDAPPVNATGGMPVMSFNVKTKDFGKIKMGDRPTFTYEFTNKGDAPLDIELVSGCDCTELEWTQTTVPIGGKGFVKATYNSLKAEVEDHKKPLKKTVDIILKQTHPKSGYPLVESLSFDVFIVD